MNRKMNFTLLLCLSFILMSPEGQAKHINSPKQKAGGLVLLAQEQYSGPISNHPQASDLMKAIQRELTDASGGQILEADSNAGTLGLAMCAQESGCDFIHNYRFITKQLNIGYSLMVDSYLASSPADRVSRRLEHLREVMEDWRSGHGLAEEIGDIADGVFPTGLRGEDLFNSIGGVGGGRDRLGNRGDQFGDRLSRFNQGNNDEFGIYRPRNQDDGNRQAQQAGMAGKGRAMNGGSGSDSGYQQSYSNGKYEYVKTEVGQDNTGRGTVTVTTHYYDVNDPDSGNSSAGAYRGTKITHGTDCNGDTVDSCQDTGITLCKTNGTCSCRGAACSDSPDSITPPITPPPTQPESDTACPDEIEGCSGGGRNYWGELCSLSFMNCNMGHAGMGRDAAGNSCDGRIDNASCTGYDPNAGHAGMGRGAAGENCDGRGDDADCYEAEGRGPNSNALQQALCRAVQGGNCDSLGSWNVPGLNGGITPPSPVNGQGGGVIAPVNNSRQNVPINSNRIQQQRPVNAPQVEQRQVNGNPTPPPRKN